MAGANQYQNVRSLGDLPIFQGESRQTGNKGFVPGINVKDFLQRLDSYFSTNGITRDSEKMNVQSAHVDPINGESHEFLELFTQSDVSYEMVRRDFFKAYSKLAKLIQNVLINEKLAVQIGDKLYDRVSEIPLSCAKGSYIADVSHQVEKENESNQESWKYDTEPKMDSND